QSGHPRTAAKLGNPATLVVFAPAQGLQKRMWAVEFPTARRGSGGNARTGSVASRRACGRDGAWLAADAGSGRETRRRPGRGGCRAGGAGADGALGAATARTSLRPRGREDAGRRIPAGAAARTGCRGRPRLVRGPHLGLLAADLRARGNPARPRSRAAGPRAARRRGAGGPALDRAAEGPWAMDSCGHAGAVLRAAAGHGRPVRAHRPVPGCRGPGRGRLRSGVAMKGLVLTVVLAACAKPATV